MDAHESGLYRLNCVPLKDMLKSSPPVPVNVTLFGNRIIADVIKIRSLGWGLESHMTSDLIRREEAQRQTHREKPCDN